MTILTQQGSVLKSHGTPDRCNIKNLSIIILFVCSLVPEEHLIGFLYVSQLDGKYITTEILKHVSCGHYSTDNIISQGYDSVSVISGIRSEAQALLQKKIGQHVPYIHCYNHQLHLAMMHAMQAEQYAKTFLS